MKPKISIIVPVYQVEKYLKKCLNSLVNQTLQDIEIIVVNDGSTDDSQKIIDAFQSKYPDRIKSYIRNNGGLSDARNYGLDSANGDYIGFVDSDDEVSLEMYEVMNQLALQHKADMVVCNLVKVDEDGKELQKLAQLPNLAEKIILCEHLSVFADLSYFACNKIFKRELFQDLRFKKGVHFEDIQLIPQLLLRCKTVAHTNQYFYHYLEREDSISKNHSIKGLDILSAVQDVAEVFEKSEFASQKSVLKGFLILEGVYSYLAYAAFVKDDHVFKLLMDQLKQFREKHDISTLEILFYQRFGRNYLLSLPFKKKIYYLLNFTGLYPLMRKLIL